MNLKREMRMVASKIMGNTHTFPYKFEEKLEFLEAAHGTHAILRDFEVWCEERKAEEIQYPIIEYLKVVDSRLGNAPEKLNLKDPQVTEISALTFERTSILPSAKAVAELLQTFTLEEISGAIREYTENLKEDETRSAMRRFFADGGAGAVILARRRRIDAGGPPNVR